ncbi:MAG: metal-dependent phosphohydrolase, partial [Planctomycetota bacterium]
DELFRALPTSFIIFRIYSRDHAHDAALVNALDAVLGDGGDAKTNM